MKKIVAVAVALGFSVTAQAKTVPDTASFVGLGGSYNSINFGDQSNYSQGISNVYDQSGALASQGAAGGSTDFTMDSQSTLAPTIQAGYFRHFGNKNLLWGAKLSYSYIDTNSTSKDNKVPQAGGYTSLTDHSVVPFTGNVVVGSYQSSLKQQIAFMPFIGQSFEKHMVYFGAGPTLSQTETKLNGVIGFADIGGRPTSITGDASNFSSSEWVYGGAATVGATYFIDSSWFIDANYTYGVTQHKKGTYSSPFTNTSEGYTTVGTLSGNYGGQVITQALTVSINKTF